LGWESNLPLCVFLLQVRSLETKNKLLEDDIHALRSRFLQPSGLRQLYETQLKDLTRVAEQMRVRRVSSTAKRRHRHDSEMTHGSP
jgi:hypothetical protein